MMRFARGLACGLHRVAGVRFGAGSSACVHAFLCAGLCVMLGASLCAPVGAFAIGADEVDGAGPRTKTERSNDPSRFTHAPLVDGHFANLYPLRLPTIGNLAEWYWDFWRDGGAIPPPGGYAAVPVLLPDLDYLRANRSDTTATWVGHATVLFQLAGVTLITDPMFSDRASPFSFIGPQRLVRVPFTIAEAPHVDVVLVSHNHYDHLDGPSIDALAKQPGGPPLFIVPRGIENWLKARGIANVVALDWWDTHDLAPVGANGEHVRITLVPVQHWSSRSPTDRFETLWGGHVVERIDASNAATYRFFFAGDTGYAPTFRELIHARFPRFDFAAIPIGAYEPNRFLRAQHVNPAEAVRIHRDLDATQSMGIHWGTFTLTTEAFDQPPRDLASAREAAGLPPDAFVVFRHGEMRILERR